MQPDRDTPTRAIWITGVLAALLGAAVLFDSEAGLNWPLWIAAASAGVIVSRRSARLTVGLPLAILLGWASILSVAVAITDNDFLRALVIANDAMLLGLAVLVSGATQWRTLSAKLIPLIPFAALSRVWLSTIREAVSTPQSISSGRAKPIVRGLLFTIPIVIVLVGLLRAADPVIAWFVNRVAEIFPQISFFGRFVFFVFLLSLTIGANALAARQREPKLPEFPFAARRATIGFTEQKMILVSTALVLWLFVLLQISYLIHSPPSAVGSGVTFAEYARNGFGQIAFAVTIVAGIILILESTRPRGLERGTERQLARLEAGLLIALELALVSAFRRIILYEQAYGFTTARIYPQVYILFLAISLIVLWIEIRKDGLTIDFGRRVAVTALALFTLLTFWNHEAWIANRNIDRSARTGKFDPAYVVGLSGDAIPTLVARRAELPVAERTAVESSLACRGRVYNRRWFEFNWRARAAAAALQNAGLPACQRQMPGTERMQAEKIPGATDN